MSMQKMHPKKNRASSWVQHTADQAKKKKRKGGGGGGNRGGGGNGSPPRNPLSTPSETYFLFGRHAVMAALANPQRAIKRLIATPNAAENLESLPNGLQPQIMNAQDISQLLPRDAIHQGLALEVKPLDEPKLADCVASGRPVVILDQVTDPHNVGAILRSCAAFDAACLILTKHNAPEESGTMAKISSGALETVPMLHVPNLVQVMGELKEMGYWCAGLDGTAEQTLRQANLSSKTVLIMGAEGTGLRRLTAENCDLLVKLPMSAQMESLNVSNACAIALYELFAG